MSTFLYTCVEMSQWNLLFCIVSREHGAWLPLPSPPSLWLLKGDYLRVCLGNLSGGKPGSRGWFSSPLPFSLATLLGRGFIASEDSAWATKSPLHVCRPSSHNALLSLLLLSQNTLCLPFCFISSKDHELFSILQMPGPPLCSLWLSQFSAPM